MIPLPFYRQLSCLLLIFVLAGTLKHYYVKGQVEKRGENPYLTDEASHREGRKIFRQNCSVCHGKSEGVGPAIGGITKVRELDWLLEFVHNPLAMAKKGDKIASELMEAYSIPMPGFAHLSETELIKVFSYIRHISTERGFTYDSVKDRERLNALMELPTEPFGTMDISISLEEEATLPLALPENHQVRQASMRVEPGDTTGALYINDQDGYLYRVLGAKVERVLDIRNYVSGFLRYPGLGSGLGSFAFHPDFAQNGRLYVSFSQYPDTKRTSDYQYDARIPVELQWVLAEIQLPNSKARFDEGTMRELMRINMPGYVHGMQDIRFSRLAKPGDEDYGLLYIGVGDGSSTNEGVGQLCHTLNSPLGTILRIDPLGTNGRNRAYGIPSDNPFVEEKGDAVWPEIYAYGFRNPHRMAWDYTHGGRLIVADVGHALFEEINVVKPGHDYGWNIRDANQYFDPKTRKNLKVIPWEETEPDFERPFALYSHREGRAISGGFVYRGSVEGLKGKYIFGDIVIGRIFCLDLEHESPGPNPQRIYEIKILDDTGKPYTLLEAFNGQRVDLRFGEDGAGELYVMTKTDGKIRKVVSGHKAE